MEASNIIENYLVEAKRLKIIPFNELRNRILNWFAKQGISKRLVDIEDDFIDDKTSAHIVFVVVPNEIFSRVLGFSDKAVEKFEREVLRGTNYIVREIGSDDDGGFVLEGNLSIEDKPKFLYHITHKSNADKIARRGLKPVKGRSDSPDSPSSILWNQPRVYFWSSKGLAKSFAGSDGEFVIFELDTDKFNRFNLFVDTAQWATDEDGYYTLTHIPGRALRQLTFDEMKPKPKPAAKERSAPKSDQYIFKSDAGEFKVFKDWVHRSLPMYKDDEFRKKFFKHNLLYTLTGSSGGGKILPEIRDYLLNNPGTDIMVKGILKGSNPEVSLLMAFEQ